MKIDVTVQQIAEIIDGNIVGDKRYRLTEISKLEDVHQSSLSFFVNARFKSQLENRKIGCVIVKDLSELPSSFSGNVILHKHPHEAIVQVIESFRSDNSNFLVDGFEEIDGAKVHASAVIGKNVTIGEQTVIHCNAAISDECTIGKRVIIYPNVTLYRGTVIGDDTIIHSGAVIGSDGFGYLQNSDGSFRKIPQVGIVEVGSNCEIGANTTIDRAALGKTVIENGVKLDNLVHIAHNAEIGADTAIAAQTGIAGASVIGKKNRIAGQVGVVGYVQTTEGVTIGAQSGVSKSIAKAGEYSGSPAQDLMSRLKQDALVRKLPEISRKLDLLYALFKDQLG